MIAVAMTGVPKISFHWVQLRLEVNIKAPFSYRQSILRDILC